MCFSGGCIQPYLVVCYHLSYVSLALMFDFVTWHCVHMGSHWCRNFMFQLVMSSREVSHLSDQFRFVPDVFLWVEFWVWRCTRLLNSLCLLNLWWSDELSLFRRPFNFYSYYCFHRICKWRIPSVPFTSSTETNLCSPYLFFLEFKFEGNVARCIIAYSFNNFTFWIFKYSWIRSLAILRPSRNV